MENNYQSVPIKNTGNKGKEEGSCWQEFNLNGTTEGDETRDGNHKN